MKGVGEDVLHPQPCCEQGGRIILIMGEDQIVLESGEFLRELRSQLVRADEKKGVWFSFENLNRLFPMVRLNDVKKTILREHVSNQDSEIFVFIADKNGFGEVHFDMIAVGLRAVNRLTPWNLKFVREFLIKPVQ
jgi:hypothetical protein